MLRRQYPSPPYEAPCGCCGKEATLQVDHDHDRVEFRGHLCLACNTSIGKLDDTLEGVLNAVVYLGRYELTTGRYGGELHDLLRACDALLTINDAGTQHSLPESPIALARARSAWSESTSVGGEEGWNSGDEGGSGTDRETAGGEAGLWEAPGRGGEDNE